jgi:hypothetical protein
MSTSSKSLEPSNFIIYGKSMLFGGLIAIFASVFFLGEKDLANGIRYGGAIMVIVGALIYVASRLISMRSQ